MFKGAGAFCVAGEVGCDSYDASAWAGTSPIRIKSVTFADGSQAKEFAAVSDLVGRRKFWRLVLYMADRFASIPGTRWGQAVITSAWITPTR